MSIFLVRPDELSYGQIRYFEANRCFNTEDKKQFNHYKISAEELVSFDCVLFNLREMESLDQPLMADTEQILAVIMRPDKTPDYRLDNNPEFLFCGYDLVEALSGISAITDCCGGFDSVPYDKLNKFGLLSTYKEAVLTQLSLIEECPEESHADCEILEIWRKII